MQVVCWPSLCGGGKGEAQGVEQDMGEEGVRFFYQIRHRHALVCQEGMKPPQRLQGRNQNQRLVG